MTERDFPDSRSVHCQEQGCNQSYKDHRWGRIKAHDAGWFFSRNEEIIKCPEHAPEWHKAARRMRERP